MILKDMLGRSGVVSREEAFKALELHLTIAPPPPEELSISLSLGRIVALDIASPEELPEFDRSTMDGFAVRSIDTFGAAESRPALLTIVGDIAMGAMPGRALSAGETMKIATGGALPKGADAVVMRADPGC
jgi:molybdopterin molybdotransferase